MSKGKPVGLDSNGKDIHIGDEVIVGVAIYDGVSEPIIDVVKEQEWGIEPVMYFKPGTLTLVD